MSQLWADFLNNKDRVIHKWKHYFPVYETHLSRFVNRPIVFLEIGCGEGGSLQMWKRYLGPHAQIVGIDIEPSCAAYEEDQIAVRIGSQADTAFLDKVIAEFGRPDVVIDDGSHVMEHVQTTFAHLYSKVTDNGLYLVEDLHTAYWVNWGGGLHRPGTFIETCKGLIDQLHAHYTAGALPPNSFSAHTMSMHFYDSMVVFERGRLLPRAAPQTGTISRGGPVRPSPSPGQTE